MPNNLPNDSLGMYIAAIQQVVNAISDQVRVILRTYILRPTTATVDAIARFGPTAVLNDSPITLSDDAKLAANGATIDMSVADTLNLVATDVLVNGAPIVIGPAVVADNALARFDSTTGRLIQGSPATLSDDAKLAANGATIDMSVADTLNLVATDVLVNGAPIPSGSFLPLTGGTLTGPLTLSILVPTTSDGIIVGGKLYIAGTRPVCSGGYSMTTNPAPVTNTAVETTITGSGVGTLVIAADTLTVGACSRSFMSGTIDTTGSPTVTFRIYAGATGTLLLASFVIAPGSLSLVPWRLESTLTCRALGSGTTGKIQVNSFFVLHDTSNASTFVNNPLIDIDTTIANTFHTTVQWSIVSAGNIINVNTFNTFNVFF